MQGNFERPPINSTYEELLSMQGNKIPCTHDVEFFASFARGKSFPIHRHNYYEVFLTLSDDMLHVINGKVVPVRKNTLVLIRPQDEHTQMWKRNWDEEKMLNIIFDKEIQEHLFSYLEIGGADINSLYESKMPPQRQLSEAQSREIVKEYVRDIQFYDTSPQMQKVNARLFLTFLFVRFLLRETQHIQNVENLPYWLEVACEKMKRPENFSHGLSRMVELSGKSKEHLARSMKKHYKMTATQYINDLRLNYVAGQLSQTDIAMLDLIYESGFQSVSYFYKLFSKKFGMSPMDYKEAHKNDPYTSI